MDTKTLGELLNTEDYQAISYAREYYKKDIDLQIKMLMLTKRIYVKNTGFRGLCSALNEARTTLQCRYHLQDIPNKFCIYEFASKYGNTTNIVFWWSPGTFTRLLGKDGTLQHIRNRKPRLAFLDWCIKVANAIKTES